MGDMPEQGSVEFWFDPSCPFTWTTSVWIRALAPAQVTVRWRLMSLPLLNAGADITEQYRVIMARAVAPLRVLAAAEQATHTTGDPASGSATLGAVYTAMGRRRHEQGRPYDRAVYVEALTECGLDPDMADAADDPRWDESVAASHQAGEDSVGEPAGSPVLAFDGHRGFFGPVLAAAPAGDGGQRLLDACRTLAATDVFAEIRRARSAT